ncbi:MAG: DHHA1 domain-containing protein, partial [Paludibacteraceae bacterium]
ELVDIQQDMLREAKDFFSNTPNLIQSIKKSIDENAELKKQVDIFIHEKIGQMKDMLMRNALEKGDVKMMLLKGEFQADMVKSIAFQIRNEMKGKMVFIGGTQTNGKPTLTVILSDDLIADGFNATTMVREAAKAIQGGGGGQPFFAQAGGKDVAGLEKALDILTNKF